MLLEFQFEPAAMPAWIPKGDPFSDAAPLWYLPLWPERRRDPRYVRIPTRGGRVEAPSPARRSTSWATGRWIRDPALTCTLKPSTCFNLVWMSWRLIAVSGRWSQLLSGSGGWTLPQMTSGRARSRRTMTSGSTGSSMTVSTNLSQLE